MEPSVQQQNTRHCSPSLHSLTLALSHVGWGVRHFKTQATTPRRHISATPLPQFYWDPWTELSGQHNINNMNHSEEPHAPKESDSTVGQTNPCMFIYCPQYNYYICFVIYSSDSQYPTYLQAGLRGSFKGARDREVLSLSRKDKSPVILSSC